MAKQIINIGTSPNDGTGDTLRDSIDKTNDNFTELYNAHGWGMYVDGLITTPTQTITSTASKISIDGAGATSESGYLPREIRGTAELWDTINNKILPINVGDSHTMRLDIEITAEASNPNVIEFDLDIGGGASPSIVIVQRLIGLGKTTPYNISIGFPFFTLSTFITNGGQLFLKTDTGTVTIGQRSLMITRISNGAL